MIMSEHYEGLENEKDHLVNETPNAEEQADLVNDQFGAPSDAGVEDIDPNPLTDEKMKREDDE